MRVPKILPFTQYKTSQTDSAKKRLFCRNKFLTGLNTDTISFGIKHDNDFSLLYILSNFSKLVESDKKQKTPFIEKINPGFITKLNNYIINKPNKPFLIAISGDSASGKTTICNSVKKIAEEQNIPVEIFSADNYFKDISGLIKEHGSFNKLLESGYDVDSPDNFDLEQLYTDLSDLSDGKDVKIPQYLINGTGVVVPKAIPINAQKIIIVEGMATMHGKAADLFDLKLFIDIKPEVQEKRYIQRAKASRNQSEENAKNQLAYVREASKKYIQPKKEDSDIILNGGCSLDYINKFIKNIYKITKVTK